MREAHSVEQVRAAEAALMAVLPGGALMQRAAAGLAATCAGLLGRVPGSRVVLLVGSGDNGGDALFAGERLARRGSRVDALLLAPKRAHTAGLAALRAAGGRIHPADAPGFLADAQALVGGADLVLDGIVGIGGRGALRPPADVLAAAAARSRALVVAVDLPSGIDADTGAVAAPPPGPDRAAGPAGLDAPGAAPGPVAGAAEAVEGVGGAWHEAPPRPAGPGLPGAAARGDLTAHGTAAQAPAEGDAHAVFGTGMALTAVRADVTVTFGTYKPGLLVDPGAEYAGVVELVGIGLTPPAPVLRAAQHADVARLLPVPARESDKYARGVLGLVAGSERYPGAAVLATGAALRGGAGAVRYVGPRPVGDAVLAAHPEVLVGDGRVQAYAVGAGLDTGSEARARLATVLDAGVPVLVDADGLTLLAELGKSALARVPGALLTPHAGEAVRLLAGLGLATTRADVEAERLATAAELAAGYGATVLLKGSTTVIADPYGETWANPTGTPYLATAGSGDVLTGLAGALLATGLRPVDAAVCAAYLHGLAGRLASADGVPCAASDVAAAAPRAWAEVRRA
ncbi:hypothetical protein GCM10023205_05920 [Yinghuangia aomiensis]|uniref:Bifunctional NAD(P)H-hydrate repair enzyme n=1 Tax=Yinghuangia aomiensis TaxID=676205 RepID=A0ABP9GS08_9ACTN